MLMLREVHSLLTTVTEVATRVFALSRRYLPFYEYAGEFCKLAAGIALDDAVILHLFRLGACYLHPMNLPWISPSSPLVPSSSPSSPLVPSSSPSSLLVPSSSPSSLLVPSSSPSSLLVKSSSPASPLLPSSSALPERL